MTVNENGQHCKKPGEKSCSTCTGSTIEFKQCNCGTPLRTNCEKCSRSPINNKECYACNSGFSKYDGYCVKDCDDSI